MKTTSAKSKFGSVDVGEIEVEARLAKSKSKSRHGRRDIDEIEVEARSARHRRDRSRGTVGLVGRAVLWLASGAPGLGGESRHGRRSRNQRSNLTGSTPLKWQAGLGPAELELDESKLDEVAVAGTAVAGGGPVVAATGGAVLDGAAGGALGGLRAAVAAGAYFGPRLSRTCRLLLRGRVRPPHPPPSGARWSSSLVASC